MQPFFDFLAHYWWLVFPLAGMAGGWGRAWSKAAERRHQRKVELYKLQHQSVALEANRTTDVEALVAAHDAVNQRWLDYELDVGKLIDFPMMTDVREPLTVAFLRAKRTADGLRPADPADMDSTAALAEYRAAVNTYEVAFDVAEHEAKRLKDSAFSEGERQRLATARKLVAIVVDDGATEAERQTAYKRARRELDGLLVLPDVSIAALEEKAAQMLGPTAG
ncbi:hypothetical protein [Arthrobacter sp. 35W]|uniref:hypothetical protein n=1 Tax=Arthrobacter sp. 35W TaxID=1132441 RepID=UPI0003FB4623|nr:hypothetical protein [Arthrobacter sp. 35W]